MPEVVLAILKYLFLLLIFLFLARAVRAMYLEISGPRRSSVHRPLPVKAPSSATTKPPERMTVTAPDEKPQTFELDQELIIGRAESCQVLIRDTYASQVHARVFKKDSTYYIEDMGSTNGTYLNRRKVTSALPLSRGDRVKIGKTELEFRK